MSETATPQKQPNNDIVLFLRTILMILENHNFRQTAQIFKAECLELGLNLIEIEPKSPGIIFDDLPKPYRIIIENENETPIKVETNKVTKLFDQQLDNSQNCVIIIENKNESNNQDENNRSMNEKFKIDNEDYELLKNKFAILQVEHHKLMDIVTELTFALQTSIKGQIEDTSVILNECEKIYPELFFNKPINNTNTKQLTRDVTTNTEFDLNQSTEQNDNSKMNYSLDYQKIKHDLKTTSDLNNKLLLLQALRWRITKSSQSNRISNAHFYIHNDILNIHNCFRDKGFTYPKNSILFTSFYCSCQTSSHLQQSVIRFVNAFAALKSGRDYILRNESALKLLLSILIGTHPISMKIDNVTKYMIVVVLEKLSVRNSARKIMISEGLTEYIVNFLCTSYKNVENYCLVSSMALLRNLLLLNTSREKCYHLSNEIIKIFIVFLDEPYTLCLPYVFESLRNLLPDQHYYQAAKRVHFDRIVSKRCEKHNGKIKEELQHILEIYSNPEKYQPLCECNLENDLEAEIEDVEPEIDQSEFIPETEINGETFLEKYRLIPTFNEEQLETRLMTANEIKNEERSIIVEDKEINSKNESNEKRITELAFCEETQQLYYQPTKERIFETDEFYKFHSFSPSFLKTRTNNTSKSMPNSPVQKQKNVESPVTVCYRQSFKPRSFSDSTPHVGFCRKKKSSNTDGFSKYSCACYAELQGSFEEDEKETKLINRNEEKVNDNKEVNTNKNYCRYKWYSNTNICGGNSVPNMTSPKKEKDRAKSKSLDETDYTSVFESRPRILRTP